MTGAKATTATTTLAAAASLMLAACQPAVIVDPDKTDGQSRGRKPAPTQTAAACPSALKGGMQGLLTDGADLLSPRDEAALLARLSEAQRRSRATIIVATVPNLESRPIEAAARCLTNTWTVNGRVVSHGAMILLAPNERRIRVATMPGTQRVLSDTRAARVIGKMTRSFRNGDYAEGLTIGADDLAMALSESDGKNGS